MPTPEPELSPILARPPRTIPTWLFAVLAVTLLLGAGGAVQVVRSGSLFGFLVTVLAASAAWSAWVWVRVTQGLSRQLTRLGVALGVAYTALVGVVSVALAFGAGD
jgi:hypothetical protein